MRRKYDKEYKIQAVKLAKEINVSRAAKELMMKLSIKVDTFNSRNLKFNTHVVKKHNIVVF